LVSVVYASGDAVGISQELHYYSNGQLRLVGTDWNAYCGQLTVQGQRELQAFLNAPDFDNELKSFGEVLTLPDAFIPETIKISHGPIAKSARIDALRGLLLELVRILDKAATEEFGRRYQLVIVDRLDQLKEAAQGNELSREESL